MTSWIEVLLAPQRIQATTGGGKSNTVKLAAAYLLQGRFIDYMDLATKNQLPPLGISAKPIDVGSPSDLALLYALAEQIAGTQTVSERYRLIAANPKSRSDIRTAAAVLGAVSLSDAGMAEDAIGVLKQHEEIAKTDLEKALIRLHLGVRHAELGQTDLASTVTRSLIDLAPRSLSRNLYGQAILIVAEHNHWHFQAASGKISSRQLPQRTESSLLARIESSVAEGLAVQLDRQFAGSFRDPYTFSMSFRSEDSTDVRLAGALLGAECFADWSQLRSIRKLRGRYLLMVSVGLADRQPDAAFHLLRRAGDREGIDRGTQLFMRVGPLGPLRRVADSTAVGNWLVSEVSCNLKLLEQTAQVMSPEAAEAALERLLSRLVEATNDSSSPRHELIDTIGSIVPVVSATLQNRIAEQLLEVATATDDGLILLSLTRNLRALNWPGLEQPTRRAWADFVGANLETNALRRNVAVAAALGLRHSEPRLAELITAAYRVQPSLQLGALLHTVAPELDPVIMSDLTERATTSLRQIRDEAKEGKHSIGYEVDAAGVLATLVLQTRSQEASNQLADFLLDELVAPIHKLTAFEVLASSGSSIPEPIVRRLVEMLPRQRFTETLFIQRENVVGSALRLLLALRGQNENEALSVLLNLATGADPISRIEAAKSIPYAFDTVAPSVLASLALTLSHDSHHDVRAAASRILPQLPNELTAALTLLIKKRTKALLEDPGVAVPLAGLDGLAIVKARGLPLDEETLSIVRRLSKDHLAWVVRFTAERVLRD